MFYEVIPIRIFRSDSIGILTYSSELPLKPGHIIEIPLGRGKTFGIVTKKVTSVDFPTKPITRLLYDIPLPSHILKSILWLSEYYLTPLPLAAKLFLPQGLGKKRRKGLSEQIGFPGISATTGAGDRRSARDDGPRSRCPGNHYLSEQASFIALNLAQKHALSALETISTPTKLLHGVTGSGKTNIYLKLAENALRAQKSTILLVPEIALTSQLVQVFESTFKTHICLIHSKQTEAERHLIWEKILNSAEPQIIIGPRSALLSPVKDLGLVIIDEAHESTYFQENTPKYSALRLASFMSSSLKIPCIFGTATPLATDYYLANSKNSLVTLDKKAKSTAIAPNFHVISLRDPLLFSKNRYFSDELLKNIEENLKKHRQTLIFHNRRGSAPLTICEKCGWQALCPSCYLPLTLHSDSYKLVCHTCGYTSNVPSSCPDCKHPSIIHKGFGTKLLESELKKLFPKAKIARFDADNTKEETLNSKFKEVKSGDYDIIVGTQTIAKGLDLPLLATVGIVQADAGLSLPDFSSEEKTFHLLTQVIGRVGRGHLDAADVFVQTYQPDHPVITSALKNDYQSFYNHILKMRQHGHFPPFYYLAKLSITYKTESLAIKYAKKYYSYLKSTYGTKIIVSQPTPAFHEHTALGYTWQIVIHSRSRTTLLSVLSSLPPNPKLHFSIDPPSLL
ncbi:primosomal protein N' [Candidatus Saccharibacteria bacterium]|nr:primosomal protein N' [Candidatus Saccharibacteria bacterium]